MVPTHQTTASYQAAKYYGKILTIKKSVTKFWGHKTTGNRIKVWSNILHIMQH